jgi:hypothetical protein
MARFRVLAMFIAAMFATAPGQGRDNFPNHDNEDRVASPARQRVRRCDTRHRRRTYPRWD